MLSSRRLGGRKKAALLLYPEGLPVRQCARRARSKERVPELRGQGFLENGDTVAGVGQGSWESIGKHKWRTRLIVTNSDGGCHASDGHLDLKSRTLSGKMMEWS